jgi:hypothetical protein
MAFLLDSRPQALFCGLPAGLRKRAATPLGARRTSPGGAVLGGKGLSLIDE